MEYPVDYGEGCLLQCDCSAECYREDSSHREYRSGRNHSRDFGEWVCTEWDVSLPARSPLGDTGARRAWGSHPFFP